MIEKQPQMATHSFTVNQSIREIQFQSLKIGGDKSFYFMRENENVCKPIFVLELPVFNLGELSHIVKDFFKTDDRVEILKQVQASDCDVLGLKFNIDNISQLDSAVELLKSLLPMITKPLLIRGVNSNSIDEKLIPALVGVLDRKCIVGFADDMTYKQIVPGIVEGGHILIIRTPIDINLAKEMNILTTDMGLKYNQILIDSDMGGLGYGLEYGYSIMERIKIAGFEGDTMLNMPLIAFAGEESLKVKEAKSDAFSSSWGELKERSLMFEIVTASAVISAGANVVVLQHPTSITTIKSLIGGVNG